MLNKERNVISQTSAVSIGLVLTLLGAALSFGVVYNKVDTLENEVAEARKDIKELTASVNRIIGASGDIVFND